MLPIDKPWYRKLLFFALLIGIVGGVGALLFTSVTGIATTRFFGGTGTGWWEGQWWWILLTAVGGLLIAILRKAWKISPSVPGSIALAQQAWINPSDAIYWVAISTISLMVGASLGPSFALIVMGGSFGSWLVGRLRLTAEEAKQEYTLTGMSGGLGAAFSAPLFATVMTSELSPTSKRNYVAGFIPELFAAVIGFIIFFGITGNSMLGSYALPPYEFRVIDLLVGVLLGIVSVFVLILFALVKKLVATSASKISNPYLRGTIGGALVGLIAFALPLTATSGSSQLATELQQSATMGVGFITAVLIAKMFAIALSQSSGFLGGVVFPIIYIGGTAGLLIHTLFPDIPVALCVGALLAAVPGAFLNAPLSLILIAAGTISIGSTALVPISIAVVVAHITMALLRNYVVKEHQLKLHASSTE